MLNYGITADDLATNTAISGEIADELAATVGNVAGGAAAQLAIESVATSSLEFGFAIAAGTAVSPVITAGLIALAMAGTALVAGTVLKAGYEATVDEDTKADLNANINSGISTDIANINGDAQQLGR